MGDSVAELADLIDEIRRAPRPRLRVGVVTAVEATAERRVKLDIAGDAWIPTDTDLRLSTTDRVYALQQGPIWIVMGVLEGGRSGVPVGSVTLYAGWHTRVPAGWLPCDGRSVSRTTYAELFDLIGTEYGIGNGTTTFNLPNTLGRFPVGAGADGTAWWLGKTGGAERVTLSTAQLPSHTHEFSHTHTVPSAAGDTTVASGTGATVASSPTATTSAPNSTTTGSAGSGQSHENLPPYLGFVFMIRVI